MAADIAIAQGYDAVVFLDDQKKEGRQGLPVVGKTESFSEYLNSWEFFVAIGNSYIREKQQVMLEQNGATIATLIHPDAVIGSEVSIGKGTIIMAGTVVNAGTTIGNGVIINTCSSVDHDNIVGAYAHIAVGAHLCGTVKIGNHTWIGAGVTVINNITITDECVIGAGGVVVKSIEESGTYIGIPVKKK